jgi:hypothetical protein
MSFTPTVVVNNNSSLNGSNYYFENINAIFSNTTMSNDQVNNNSNGTIIMSNSKVTMTNISLTSTSSNANINYCTINNTGTKNLTRGIFSSRYFYIQWLLYSKLWRWYIHFK